MVGRITTVQNQYYNAERSAKDLIYSYEDFRRMEKSEIQALVTAICQAAEAERKSVASDIGSRARDKVRDQYDRVERRRNETLEMLKAVIVDERFNSKKSDAERLRSNVEEKWQSIERMASVMRGSNHPVGAFMVDKGKEEHDYRQGRCTAREVNTGNGASDTTETSV